MSIERCGLCSLQFWIIIGRVWVVRGIVKIVAGVNMRRWGEISFDVLVVRGFWEERGR